ncbi:thiamine pyrophosphate-binding protein [Azospirillum sp. ST 5-10]|uniref:thiamine pyrophosphate-binding protein n=1 Tax=unclassified Azospirillum TaxID=2630922 RepID=UPI003F4A2C83
MTLSEPTLTTEPAMPKDLAPHATGNATAAVGDLVVAMLEAAGVATAFGVISLHNMPILDAIGRRGAIRFVTARGEAGAVNMADAAARVSGHLTLAVTSTGTGAGNGVGALVEAMTAGTPMIHLTGQIDSPYLDRGWGFIHEAADQPGTLAAASKAFFRVTRADEAVPVMRAAIRAALAAPTGPVSVEIPIDVQKAMAAVPESLAVTPPDPVRPAPADVAWLAVRLLASRRPLLWVGGGARHAGAAVRRLADLGVGVLSSVSGRGILPEDHAMSLAAYTAAPAVAELYGRADLMLVAGTHLRSNETRTYGLRLPSPLLRVDVDPRADGRGYPGDGFVQGDAALVLDVLADALEDGWRAAADWPDAVAAARAAAEADLVRQMGPYAALRDAVAAAVDGGALWVRDITLSNSIWGNRSPVLRAPGQAVHAAGGGIGQGLPHAIGAAVASGRRTVAITGDGALQLCLGELGTLVEEAADVTLIVMNDGGYGVIRNIQDAAYGARRMYTDLRNPDFARIAAAYDLPYARVDSAAAFADVVGAAVRGGGPRMVEVDMAAVGAFGIRFAGPPVTVRGAEP